MKRTKEWMSHKERWDAILSREPVDRVPFFPMGNAGFCCRNAGYPILDAYASGARYFEAEQKNGEQYGYYPFTYASTGGSYGAWEFGGEIQMPEGEFDMAPKVLKYPVQSEEDVWKLELPDVKTDGSIPNNMRISRLQEAMPGMPITPTVHGVLTVAGNLVGVEILCRWMMKKPELARHLIRLAARHFVDVAKYWVDTFGPERIILFTAAPTETNQIISPRQFETFVLPHQKWAHERILAMGIQHLCIHICGDQNLNLPLWQQIPMGDPGIVSFGHEVDLNKAAEFFPDDIIVGNVHPPTILMGTTEEIYQISRLCIEKGKNAPGGFMLAPGCFVSPLTPPYNYWLMHKALDDYGWYA